MEIDDVLKQLEDHAETFAKLLDDCNNGSTELTLFASKMKPLFTNFSNTKAELGEVLIDSKESKNSLTKKDTTTK